MHSNNQYYSLAYIKSPIGEIVLIASEKAIEVILFSDDKQEVIEEFTKKNKGKIVEQENSVTKAAKQQLGEYFSGCRTNFDLPLNFTGTDFQQKVWNELQKIPFGQTITYSQLAIYLGDRNKIRAVAAANAKNNILLVVPCHRVVGENQKLVGYRGGLERKRWLLNLEEQNTDTINNGKLF